MSNQEAIALLRNLEDALDSYCELNEEGKTAFRMAIEALSCSENPNNSDCISRQAALDAVNSLIDRFERILSDIRESRVDDSVCGLCEYDGAYMGQSGDWCNECPGFDKDDCFKLSDECRKRWLESVELPSAQPEPCEDAVSREAVSSWLKQYGQDVLHGKYKFSLMYIWKNLMDLPSAQPTIEPRKKGKWIFCENETGEGSNTYKCSACGEIQMIISGTPKENRWKYCPHCGAKME